MLAPSPVGVAARSIDVKLGPILNNADKMSGTAQATLIEAKQRLIDAKETMQRLDGTLSAAQTTMKRGDVLANSTNALLAPGSPLTYELINTLKEVAVTARSARALMQTFEHDPNAILVGRPASQKGERRVSRPTEGRSRAAIIALAVGTLVTGCASLLGGSPPLTYYALTSTSSGDGTRPPADSRIIAVQTVRLPEYLNQKGIVTRTEANELNVAANSQWAGTLDDNITKVIVADLSRLLGTTENCCLSGECGLAGRPRRAGRHLAVRSRIGR